MSSAECLRGFINERLTAAAEEIFGVFLKTILEYEEEIDRHRKLLDVRLHRTELPQQRVCTEDEVLADQLLCNQEGNSSLDQEDPEPCSSQEGEQLALKQETDAFMLIPPYEESDHSEPEPNSDQQLLSHNSHGAESQNQEGDKHEELGSTRAAKSKSKKRTHTDQKQFKCETCGSVFKYKSQFVMHQRVHTGEKPFACNTCGTRFTQRSALNCHIRLHTGEISCQFCGKAFRRYSNLSVHMRNHTDDKLYPCNICGIQFNKGNLLKAHMRVHREVVQ